MIFALVQDFADALAAMPQEHPRRHILALLDEAIRRDVHFIDRHPTTLFQCLWNSCWWYDCPEAARHYIESESNSPAKNRGQHIWQKWLTRVLARFQRNDLIGPSPAKESSAHSLSTLLEAWRGHKNQTTPDFVWLRSLRPPPQQLGSGQKLILRGHERSVYCVAVSPNGRLLASGGDDQTLRLWDANNGAKLLCLRGHQGAVRSVAFTLNGKWLVSGSDDKTIRLWDVSAGAELHCLRGHEGKVLCVSSSPDSQRLVSGSDDKTIRIWDVDCRAEIHCLRGHESDVVSVAFASDGQRIVSSGSYDHSVRVWDAASGAELHRFRGHGSGTKSGAFASYEGSHFEEAALSPNGKHVAALEYCSERLEPPPGAGPGWMGSRTDFMLFVWDLTTGAQVHCLESGRHALGLHGAAGIAFSPDSAQIVTKSGKTVRVWNIASGAEVRSFQGHLDEVNGIAFSPDGQCIVSCSRDKTVRVWDATSDAKVRKLVDHEWKINCLEFSLDGKALATGSSDAVRVWDIPNGVAIHCLQGHQCIVTNVLFSPCGRWLTSRSEDDRQNRIWDLAEGTELQPLKKDFPFHIGCERAVWDGRRLITGDYKGVVRVWDAANAIELHRFQAGDRSVESLGLSPDGRRIASGSRGIIRVWNLESGTAIRTINCFANPHKMESGRLVMSDKVESLRFTPDGQQIIGESPHERCVWHADTGSVSSDALQLAWRGTRHGLEMMAGSNGADQPFVWFPIYEFQGLSSDLSGRICATNINEYLCLFMIEGAVPPDSAVPSVM